MAEEKSGMLLILTGASGSGKTGISEEVIKIPELGLKKGITCTTRLPREGEVNGKDYHFLTMDEFERGIDKGEFIEFAKVYGRYYGNRKSDMEEMAKTGGREVRVLDVQGARAVQKNFFYPNVSVFVSAGDIDEHRRRLMERGKDSREDIERRLASAPAEIAMAQEFDYLVENPYGLQSKAVEKVVEILKKKYA